MVAKKEALFEGISDRQIFMERVVDAPRDLVWDAWINPENIAKWWGPNGFTTTIEKMNVKPGGEWVHIMRGPDGVRYANRATFMDVVKPERITFSHSGGKEGAPSSQFESIWYFESLGNRTLVSIHMLFPSAADRNRALESYDIIEGGNQTLARLGEFVARLSAESMSARDFAIARVLDAPRDLVFKAFTDPERMSRWWGPRGYTVTASKMDLRPDGSYLYGLRSHDGVNMWGKLAYREIDEPARLVFTTAFTDKAGNITRHPMNPNWPLQLLTTITFDQYGRGTMLSVCWSLLATATIEERRAFNSAHADMCNGWSGTLDQLAAYLEEIEGIEKRAVTEVKIETSENSAIFTSMVNQPRTQIFDAWTNPKHIPHWMLGPAGWTMPVCESDLRPNGPWHFIWRNSDGSEMEMSGVYQEITAPVRLVSTESWGGEWPDTLNTLTLTENHGVTTISVNVRYPSPAARDAAMQTGMAEGMAKSYDRLAAYLHEEAMLQSI